MGKNRHSNLVGREVNARLSFHPRSSVFVNREIVILLPGTSLFCGNEFNIQLLVILKMCLIYIMRTRTDAFAFRDLRPQGPGLMTDKASIFSQNRQTKIVITWNFTVGYNISMGLGHREKGKPCDEAQGL